MKIFDLNDIGSDGVNVDTLLELIPTKEGNISFGTATFSAGIRHPEEDMTSHDQHEISYIIDGSMNLHTDQGVTRVAPGQVIWLEANERHASETLSDSKVFWILYG